MPRQNEASFETGNLIFEGWTNNPYTVITSPAGNIHSNTSGDGGARAGSRGGFGFFPAISEDFPPGFRLFMTVPRGVELLRQGREKEALRWLEDEQGLPRADQMARRSASRIVRALPSRLERN